VVAIQQYKNNDTVPNGYCLMEFFSSSMETENNAEYCLANT